MVVKLWTWQCDIVVDPAGECNDLMISHSINNIPGDHRSIQRNKLTPFNPGGYRIPTSWWSSIPGGEWLIYIFNGITIDSYWGNIYDCYIMGIIILLLVIVFVMMISWFMEGYYVNRYKNRLTRFWRDHVIGEDIW